MVGERFGDLIGLHRLAGCGMLECACDGGGQYCRRVSVILKNLSAITSLGGNNPIAALLLVSQHRSIMAELLTRIDGYVADIHREIQDGQR